MLGVQSEHLNVRQQTFRVATFFLFPRWSDGLGPSLIDPMAKAQTRIVPEMEHCFAEKIIGLDSRDF